MGSTPKYGLPWPELGDDADGPGGFRNLAQAVESALGDEYMEDPVNLSGFLLPGFTIFAGSTFTISRMGKLRVISGYISGTFPTTPATTTITSALDAGDRPSQNQFSFAYLSGANPGSAFIRDTGDIAITNMSSTSRTNGQFTIVYRVP